MAVEEPSVRPETHALDALIKATIQCAAANADPTSPDTMLFMPTFGGGEQPTI